MMAESLTNREGGSRPSWRRPGVGVAWLAAAVLAFWATDTLHARLPPSGAGGGTLGFVPDPALARVLSLGFGAVVADFYWLQAVQTVGGDVRMTPELGDHLGKLIDVVTTLNPRVDHPYRFAAIWMTESEQNVRTANRLLARGIDYHPEEWRNYFYLGFNHFFYLLENEQAAEWLERASRLPGAPRYLPRLAARLKSESAEIEVAEAFLREMLNASPDEVAQEGYRAALDEIEVERSARLLDEARVVFQNRNGRDLRGVEELMTGEFALLERLPPAEPSSLPGSLRRNSTWQLDPASGQIVSTYYGKRYRLHVGESDRQRAEGWAKERGMREQNRGMEGSRGKASDGSSSHDR